VEPHFPVTLYRAERPPGHGKRERVMTTAAISETNGNDNLVETQSKSVIPQINSKVCLIALPLVVLLVIAGAVAGLIRMDLAVAVFLGTGFLFGAVCIINVRQAAPRHYGYLLTYVGGYGG
jgi:hypothetical protein